MHEQQQEMTWDEITRRLAARGMDLNTSIKGRTREEWVFDLLETINGVVHDQRGVEQSITRGAGGIGLGIRLNRMMQALENQTATYVSEGIMTEEQIDTLKNALSYTPETEVVAATAYMSSMARIHQAPAVVPSRRK